MARFGKGGSLFRFGPSRTDSNTLRTVSPRQAYGGQVEFVYLQHAADAYDHIAMNTLDFIGVQRASGHEYGAIECAARYVYAVQLDEVKVDL